jgi:hypothetical protein
MRFPSAVNTSETVYVLAIFPSVRIDDVVFQTTHFFFPLGHFDLLNLTLIFNINVKTGAHPGKPLQFQPHPIEDTGQKHGG